jgi:hypothetical protein
MQTFPADTYKTTAVYDPKPMAYKALRLWLSDGSRMLGMWTGVKWWSTKGEIRPVRWELEERKKKKTDKLRKVIARDEKLTCGCYRAAIGSQAFPAIASAGKGSKTGLKRYPSARTVSSL